MTQEERVNQRIKILKNAMARALNNPNDYELLNAIIAQNELIVELITVAINGLYSEDCYIGKDRVVYPNLEDASDGDEVSASSTTEPTEDGN